MCRKRRITGTVHTVRDSEAGLEEVAAGDLTYGPAEKSGTVVTGLTVLVGWLVFRWTVAGPATPGVGCARGGEGFGEDFGPDVAWWGVLGGFDAALYVVVSWARPGLVGGVSLKGNVGRWMGEGRYSSSARVEGAAGTAIIGDATAEAIATRNSARDFDAALDVYQQLCYLEFEIVGLDTCMSSGSCGQSACG